MTLFFLKPVYDKSTDDRKALKRRPMMNEYTSSTAWIWHQTGLPRALRYTWDEERECEHTQWPDPLFWRSLTQNGWLQWLSLSIWPISDESAAAFFSVSSYTHLTSLYTSPESQTIPFNPQRISYLYIWTVSGWHFESHYMNKHHFGTLLNCLREPDRSVGHIDKDLLWSSTLQQTSPPINDRTGGVYPRQQT